MLVMAEHAHHEPGFMSSHLEPLSKQAILTTLPLPPLFEPFQSCKYLDQHRSNPLDSCPRGKADWHLSQFIHSGFTHSSIAS